MNCPHCARVCSYLWFCSLAYQPNKRWRVVTLDGDLIEASGTLSGGGATKQRGAMRAALAAESAAAVKTEKELQRLTAALEASTEQLRQLKQRHRDLDQELAQLTRAIPAAELDVRKAALALEALTTQAADQQARFAQLNSAPDLSAEEIHRVAQLKEELAAGKAAVITAKRNSVALEADIAAVEQSILDAGGAELREQKAAVERLVTQVDQLTAAMSQHTVDANAAKKAVEKGHKAVAAAQAEVAACAQVMETLKAAIKQMEEEAMVNIAANEAAQSRLDDKTKALAAFSKEFDTSSAALHKLRGVQLELQNQWETAQAALAEHDKKIHGHQRKMTEAVRKVHDTFPDTVIPLLPVGEAPAMAADALLKALPARADIELAIVQLEKHLSNMKPNMGAIAAYRQKEVEYLGRVRELDEMTAQRDGQRKTYDSLRKQRLEEFMTGFSIITLKLKEMYQMLTLGGDAELELVDSLDPFAEGIVFSVRPPKKSWKNIANLSGGEKTLSSLALVFALHHYKPTPLYVMDEIDAALDFKNVSIVANYIKERTKDAQFIIISLRNNMFEMADRLVGIYKTQNSSKSITINPHNFTAPAAPAAAAAAPAAAKAGPAVSAALVDKTRAVLNAPMAM